MCESDIDSLIDQDEFLDRFNNLAESIGKLIISLATGTVVVTMTFIKDLLPEAKTSSMGLLKWGWGFEIFSLIFGILYLYSFLRFYDKPYKARVISKNSAIALVPFIFGVLQFIFFILGLAFIALFALSNL